MRKWFVGLALAACATWAAGAHAAWPDRPIRMVVPYSAGGTADSLARVVAAELSTRLKQQVVVENRPGAGGTIGAQAVAKAPADGYTLLYDATAFTVNPSLFPKLAFDYGRDFAPIGMAARVPTMLVVAAGSSVGSVADLVRAARADPGRVTYASAGNGSAAHLTAEIFAHGFRVKLTHVPYKGGAPAMTDLIGGRVDMMFSAVTTSGPMVKSGRLKAIATAFDRRVESFGDVPTVAESGLPGFSAYEWNALFAPAATPVDVVTRLETELRDVLAQPDVKRRFAELGAIPAVPSARQLDGFIRTETARWSEVVKAAGITLD